MTVYAYRNQADTDHAEVIRWEQEIERDAEDKQTGWIGCRSVYWIGCRSVYLIEEEPG